MRTINSLDEILKLAESSRLYVRWSRGPAKDKAQRISRDYVSGGTHSGLSAQRINPDNAKDVTAQMLVEYGFLRRKDAKIYGWLFYGTENGTDSDNAPTVDADSIEPVAKLSDELVNKLTAYKNDYWQYNRTSPKSFADRENWWANFPKLEDYI